MKRIFALLPALVLALCLLTGSALAADTFDTANFKGLVLVNTASGVSVTLYKGYADSAPEITPVHTEGNAAYYEVVAGGKYKYVAKPASGYSHYHIRKNIYITAEEAQQKHVIDVTPPVRTANGWDPWDMIKAYSDEAMAAAFPSDPDLWPAYKHLFTTPLFNEGRFPHRQTTQTEMMDYISSLDGAEDNMYVYILGKSGGAKASEQFDIPVVFFTRTDLSGASTWEEAAALLRENGKLTFMYQAQIHSKEPGNGEAALALLQDFDGDYGEGLLDNMNLCVIPRLNTWGAYKSKRTVYLNGSEVDANRDFLKVETVEVQLRNHLYNAVEPEVYYDAHECNLHAEYEKVSMRDVWISTNFTPKATADFKDTALTVCYKIFDRAKENNLTYGWYSSSVNGYNPVMSTTNVAMRGSLVFLNESHGIWGGMQQIERRIMSHVSVVTAILDYINENTAAVQKVVDDQRADIVNRGKTYEESDIIVLKSDYTMHPEHYINGKQVDTGSGEITDTVHQGKIYDVVKKSRPAPTAYVIPAGQSWTAAVLEKLDIHGIAYTKLPAATVQLQQYTGTTSAATLTAEKAVSFADGAYVMTLAQEDGYILAVLMEPDVEDVAEQESTFAQMGLIPSADGVFPIYRYIRDLNADGTITYSAMAAAPEGLTVVAASKVGENGKITGLDRTKAYEYRPEGADSFTAVPAGATEVTLAPGKYGIRFAATGTNAASAEAAFTVGYEKLRQCVVYINGKSGVDTNTGLTQDQPVKYVATAMKKLDFLMEYADEGVSAKLVLTDNITIASAVYTMPSYDYHLIITSATGKEGFYHNASSNTEKRYFTVGGDTTLENMTITLKTRYTDNYLCAGGHKLVIENSVKTVSNQDGSYFNLLVGSGETTTGGELIVKGGTWRYVYAGAYQSAHNGTSRVELSDCTIDLLANSYNYAADGDIYLSLKNVTVNNAIYCGNRNSKDIDANVTLVLGEGVTAPKIYAGGKAGNVTGTVTVIADGIDLTANTIHGKAESATGTVGGLKLVLNKGQLADVASSFLTRDGVEVVLGCDQTKAVTIPYNTNLDLGGNNASGITVADGKTMTVKDTGDTLGILSATGTVVAAEGYEEKVVTGGKSYPALVTAIPGDMDGNSEKNTEDAVYLLLNVLFGEGQYPINSAADRDLNNDNKVDTEDAVYLLLNVLFGENQYPI